MPADLKALTADIVAAYVVNNAAALADLPTLIESVHQALWSASAPVEPTKQQPAVAIRSSVKPDYIVSLESGRKLKMLKRYLRTTYGMSPEEYRAKWGLPPDYPVTAPNYVRQRADMAKRAGLGRRRADESNVANENISRSMKNSAAALWPASDYQADEKNSSEAEVHGDEPAAS